MQSFRRLVTLLDQLAVAERTLDKLGRTAHQDFAVDVKTVDFLGRFYEANPLVAEVAIFLEKIVDLFAVGI